MPVTLNSNGPTPTQMLNAKEAVLLMYSQISKLRAASHDNQALASFLRLMASETMTNVYGDDDEERISQEMGDKATNLARMKFCLAGAAAAQLKGDQQTLEMELLRAALYFGASHAGQALLEANEAGLITLTDAEICDIVETMIFWREEAQKTNSPVPQEVQMLPALINLKKAWPAVYKKRELFNQLLEVAYLKSGVTCQEMLDANEQGTIKLTHSEVRRLIEQQITLYREISASESREVAMQHAPKLLTQAEPWRTQPKAWAAIQEGGLASFTLLKNFNDFITTQLPEAARVETLNALVATTEIEPGRFVEHFQDSVTQAAVKKNTERFVEDQAFNTMRTNNLLAQVELRHEVAKPLVREIYDMRPKITKKREKNVSDDRASADRISAEKARLDAEDAADLLEHPNPEVTIRYIGQGKGGMRDMFDKTIGKPVVQSRADFNKKVASASAADKDRYAIRIRECEAIYHAYLGRRADREKALETFKANEKIGSEARSAELLVLENQERDLIAAFKAMNPLATCIREALLAMTRDLAVYGTVTHNWLSLIARMVAEDAFAYRTGTKDQFGYDGVKGTKIKNERMPVFIAANEPVELALLKVFFDANPGLVDKKNLTDYTNKAVLDAFLKGMQDNFLDANGHVIMVDPIDFLEKHFPLDESANTEIKKAARKEETRKAVEKNTVRARGEDLTLIVIESLKLAALALTMTHLFPEANADVIGYTDLHSTRLLKLVASMNVSSRLRNYFMVALVAMHNPAALKKLADLQDTNNPLNQYGVSSMEKEVSIALKGLVRTNYQDISVSDLDNAFTLLAYLKQQLELVDEVTYLLAEGAVIRLNAETKLYNQKGKGDYSDSEEAVTIKAAAVLNREQRAALVTSVGSERRESVTIDTRRSSTTQSLVTSVSNTPVKNVDAIVTSPVVEASNQAEKIVVAPVNTVQAEPAPVALTSLSKASSSNNIETAAPVQQSVVATVVPVVDLAAERAKMEADMRATMEAEMKAKEAEMKAKLEAEKATLEVSRKAQEAAQQKLQLAQQKIESERQQLATENLATKQSGSPVQTASVSLKAVIVNKTTGDISEVEGSLFVADDVSDFVGMGTPGTEAYQSILNKAEIKKATLTARRASLFAQINKPKVIMMNVLVSKFKSGTIEVITCDDKDPRVKNKDLYTFIGRDEQGSAGFQGLIEKANGEVVKEAMLKRSQHTNTEEPDDSDKEDWLDEDSSSQGVVKAVTTPPPSAPVKKQEVAAPKAMFTPPAAPVAPVAPVVTDSSSSEPKKLSMKERAALLGFGGAKPAPAPVATSSDAPKPAAPVAKKGEKKTSKWGVIETSSVALSPEEAARATASRPSLAGLFGNVAPADNGNVLAAIKPGTGTGNS